MVWGTKTTQKSWCQAGIVLEQTSLGSSISCLALLHIIFCLALGVAAAHQAGAFTVTGLPGYTGYVPGKVAENVHALTFQKANERAIAEAQMRKFGQTPLIYRGRSYDGPAPGAEVPGYTGFIPGRYANNVIGSTFAKGAGRPRKRFRDI
ncbi:unnamed protein product [Durusdinium trenchii]|uniref:PS II complex 12 kDa extrinsic protein n=1 Tax=Durusdinium trenchii TaxID=1381693 RepID=A0ABP0REZ8_9DINO